MLVNVKFDQFIALVNSAVVALAFNVGAYNAEAIRAGILAVHKGQTEADRSLGLTPFMTFRDVVFPQAFRISLPPLVKTTSSGVAPMRDATCRRACSTASLAGCP